MRYLYTVCATWTTSISASVPTRRLARWFIWVEIATGTLCSDVLLSQNSSTKHTLWYCPGWMMKRIVRVTLRLWPAHFSTLFTPWHSEKEKYWTSAFCFVLFFSQDEGGVGTNNLHQIRVFMISFLRTFVHRSSCIPTLLPLSVLTACWT